VVEPAEIKRKPVDRNKPKPDSPEKNIADARRGKPRKRGGYAG
jgi:hypothetical protein